jgi:7,8-dihydro-6-hydroxymethylpterin-pyrophosphokinase
MAGRRHVLVPLAELAPGLVIPGLRKTVQAALDQLKDASQVKIHAPS